MIREYWRFQSDCPTFRPVDPTGRRSDRPIRIRSSDLPTVRVDRHPTVRLSVCPIRIRPSVLPTVRSGSDRPTFRPSGPDPTARPFDRPIRPSSGRATFRPSDPDPTVRPSDSLRGFRPSALPTGRAGLDRPTFRPSARRCRNRLPRRSRSRLPRTGGGIHGSPPPSALAHCMPVFLFAS